MTIRHITFSQLFFIILEFISGLGFSILAIYIYSVNSKVSLNTFVFNGLLIAYISMLLGIILIGYFHLKKLSSLKNFIAAIINCFAGFFLSVMLFIILSLIFYVSSFFVTILMPLVGAVLGFNFELFKIRKKV